MDGDHQKGSPCATCPLLASSICGALLGRPAEEQRRSQDGLRQTFAGADPRQTIYFRGEASEDFHILCYGWAAGVAELPGGRRQILSVLLPGDLFSLKMIFEKALHFSVEALTEVRFSRINRADLKGRLAANPGILDALVKICIAEREATDALLVDLGRRTADERFAHLILRLADRLGSRNVIREQRYPFPLRQQDISDILGLSPVHVSRVINKFRRADLIELSRGTLTILDLPALRRIGGPEWSLPVPAVADAQARRCP